MIAEEDPAVPLGLDHKPSPLEVPHKLGAGTLVVSPLSESTEVPLDNPVPLTPIDAVSNVEEALRRCEEAKTLLPMQSNNLPEVPDAPRRILSALPKLLGKC